MASFSLPPILNSLRVTSSGVALLWGIRPFQTRLRKRAGYEGTTFSCRDDGEPSIGPGGFYRDGERVCH